MRVKLRDYQHYGIDEIRAQIRGGHTRILYTLPTGGGKTVIFSYITEGAARKGKRVLILVHRRELIFQTSESLFELGVEHGIIAPKHHQTVDAVQVASVQTLARRVDKGASPRFDLIIVDEAHHATAGSTWGKVLESAPGAVVLGVTATPERLDGKGLGVDADGFFDVLIQGPSMQWLVDQGYLSEPLVYAPPVTADLSGLHTRAGEFMREEVESVMDTSVVTGDAVTHYRRLIDGAPAIGFCASIRHANHVADHFKREGIRAAALSGKTHHAERKQMLRDLGRCELQMLASCDVISEGTDVPIVAGALLLRPTKSQALYLQQVGRALRIYPGKKHAVILDHAGNAFRHGHPIAEREWSLEGRKKSGNGGESVTAVKQCPNCYAVHIPAPKCPSCGHKYEESTARADPEQVDGDLELVDKEKLRQMRKREEWMAQTMEEFVELGKSRGYKNPRGWAYHRMKHKRRNAREQTENSA